VWAIPRTSHWTATALEDAGFEVRDVITHHFGSGFPKSQDVGKFIDKALGVTEWKETTPNPAWRAGNGEGAVTSTGWHKPQRPPKPVVESDAAKRWSGWGTALKPATEHWILVRKPLSEASISKNVLKWGTGALNIDACRVHRDSGDVPGWHKTGAKGSEGYRGERCGHCDGEDNSEDCDFCGGTGYVKGAFAIRDMTAEEIQERCGDKGRWPTNLLLSHSPSCADECVKACPVAEMDAQSGIKSSGSGQVKISSGTKRGTGTWTSKGGMQKPGAVNTGIRDFGDSGGASRFFPTFRYQAKPSRSEREAGLDDEPTRTLNRVNPGGIEHDPRWAPVQVRNNHPTVKGIELMKWLLRLVTPEGGYVLEPFLGSGSTGCAAVQLGYGFFGCDKDTEYVAIARARIRYWQVKTDTRNA
jgi:site-specific DNA-methyltransferase (adenine-specific)